MIEKDRAKILSAYKIFKTKDGQIVLDHLKAEFGYRTNMFRPDKEGHLCALRASTLDGQRSVVIHIESLAERAIAEPKPQTQVIK
jgi:hypothetical protein